MHCAEAASILLLLLLLYPPYYLHHHHHPRGNIILELLKNGPSSIQ
jgi:hypothetical protein